MGLSFSVQRGGRAEEEVEGVSFSFSVQRGGRGQQRVAVSIVAHSESLTVTIKPERGFNSLLLLLLHHRILSLYVSAFAPHFLKLFSFLVNMGQPLPKYLPVIDFKGEVV